MKFHDNKNTTSISLDKEKGEWLLAKLATMTPGSEKPVSFGALKKDFEVQFEDFELCWFSKSINTLKERGLLVL